MLESRLVCGLTLVPRVQRYPRHTTTRGVGELLSALGTDGAARVFVGLGGSATMDGGTGMARGWGWAFLDAAGAPLPEGGGGLGPPSPRTWPEVWNAWRMCWSAQLPLASRTARAPGRPEGSGSA